MHSADWPAWRGPDGNGIAAEPLPAGADFENIASRGRIGIGFSSIAIAGGRAFAIGHDGTEPGGRETVWCLDATSGELLWQDAYQAELLPNQREGGPGAAPVVDGGRLYTLSKDGRLQCYDAVTGGRCWTSPVLAKREDLLPEFRRRPGLRRFTGEQREARRRITESFPPFHSSPTSG